MGLLCYMLSLSRDTVVFAWFQCWIERDTWSTPCSESADHVGDEAEQTSSSTFFNMSDRYETGADTMFILGLNPVCRSLYELAKWGDLTGLGNYYHTHTNERGCWLTNKVQPNESGYVMCTYGKVKIMLHRMALLIKKN